MSNAAKEGQRALDHSKKFNAVYAVEIPFWVSIESGKYDLPDGQQLNLRNDLWLLTIGNLVDDPPDKLGFFIFYEKQVEDPKLLSHFVGESSHYHKRKMKTTFTRSMEIIPIKGALSARPGTEEWVNQLELVAMSVITFERHQELLHGINSFLDYYIAIISPALTFGEVRRVSFFDAMFRIVFDIHFDGITYMHSTRNTPDIRMANIPYPPFRVKVRGQSQQFREAIQTLNAPAFHQLQWAQTLNHYREGRSQESLLSGAIVLEALAYSYWSKSAVKKKGMARWLRNLEHSQLQKECHAAADLWDLRNKVVHEQRELTQGDLDIINQGIRALGRLRPFLLQKLDPDIIKLEHEFSSFLEPTHLIAASPPIRKTVPIAIQWRREIDHYEEYNNRQV